jgi:hypothetical protein
VFSARIEDEVFTRYHHRKFLARSFLKQKKLFLGKPNLRKEEVQGRSLILEVVVGEGCALTGSVREL